MSENFTNPTDTINSLIFKFTLCLMSVASAFLFYNMSNKKNTAIPRITVITMAIVFLVLSIAVSITATYEFYTTILKYKNCNNCLYSKKSLEFISNFYCTFCLVFVITNIYICYLLIKYHK